MTRIDNTKDNLQQELLAKIKPGTKPSDLKKKPLKPRPKELLPPPISISEDEGYVSEGEIVTKRDKSPILNQEKVKAKPIDPSLTKLGTTSFPPAPPLPNSQVKNLQAQVKALQRQIQVYQDFKEADLKIKEKYKQNISNLQAKIAQQDQTISELKNPAKTTTDINPQSIKTFTCAECGQEKSQQELSRVFGKFAFCLDCSKKARQAASQQKQNEPQPIQFTCHLCQQIKTEAPAQLKLDKTLQEYPVCSSCKPLAKEFNEADLITDDLWEKYPYSSASEILELEFGIVRK